MLKLFTIGFAGTAAQDFFHRIRQAGVRKVIDTRLWPDTQLSGFARKKNLPFFLKHLSDTDYEHRFDLAPTEELLKDFKDKRIDWSAYEKRYLDLLQSRHIAEKFVPQDVTGACFLCAEKTPQFCHRRLLVEYLQREWNTRVEIVHL